ncbi:MAG: hypothetical protein M3N57_02240 [Actinomycetota bacterium]|nr:hypothetical protein [Actinomycetota bacterium]
MAQTEVAGTQPAGTGWRSPGDGPTPDDRGLVPVVDRRRDVVRRLLERGVAVHALQVLLPGWDDEIRAAASDGHRP